MAVTGRRWWVAVVVTVVLSSAGPTAATAQPPAGGSGQSLVEARGRLQDARGQLTEADRVVTQARADLASIQANLGAQTAELRRLEVELAEAEAAHRAARTRTVEVEARLRTGDRELAALVERQRGTEHRLGDHAATTYMHGGRTRPAGMYTALLGADDLHELEMGRRVVQRSLDDDGALAAAARELALRAARTRRDVAALRAQRQAEEAAAWHARDRAQALARRQAQLTAEVQAVRDRRAAILQRTEADRDQARVLVEQLQALAAQLAGELRAAIHVRWQDLVIDGPMPAWAERLPAHGRRWAPAIAQAAGQAGIDPRLFAALVWAESSFHVGALSHAGAVGLAQLMPGTAARLGVDPEHPLQNLAGGARYLAEQHATFGSVELALAAYNAGPGAVLRHGGVPPYAETRYYVLAVLGYYQRLIG
ncbi:MAG TPA: lytic transglycosylase domain-containing protein [Nitriliruptorales bacterium]|nr:lytic transglycosylase domain-containing protein [Nitriliruptorales bacterium]